MLVSKKRFRIQADRGCLKPEPKQVWLNGFTCHNQNLARKIVHLQLSGKRCMERMAQLWKGKCRYTDTLGAASLRRSNLATLFLSKLLVCHGKLTVTPLNNNTTPKQMSPTQCLWSSPVWDYRSLPQTDTFGTVTMGLWICGQQTLRSNHSYMIPSNTLFLSEIFQLLVELAIV